MSFTVLFHLCQLFLFIVISLYFLLSKHNKAQSQAQVETVRRKKYKIKNNKLKTNKYNISKKQVPVLRRPEQRPPIRHSAGNPQADGLALELPPGAKGADFKTLQEMIARGIQEAESGASMLEASMDKGIDEADARRHREELRRRHEKELEAKNKEREAARLRRRREDEERQRKQAEELEKCKQYTYLKHIFKKQKKSQNKQII